MGPDPQYVGKVSFCLLVYFFPLLGNCGWNEGGEAVGFEDMER